MEKVAHTQHPCCLALSSNVEMKNDREYKVDSFLWTYNSLQAQGCSVGPGWHTCIHGRKALCISRYHP